MNKEKLRYYYLKLKYQYIRISKLARFKINEIRQKIKDRDFKKLQQFKNITFNKKYFFIGSMVLLVFLALLVGRQFSPGSSLGSIGGDDRLDPPKAIASQELKTKFDFPIRDNENVEVAKVSYEIERASLQNSFIYQGKLAKSVRGRTFLIFDLKITNPYEKGIEINTIDYIRISRNNSDELLAPEIHNDPVQIQANSTKYTRIGVPINESDKDIKIFVGELKGNKEEVKLNF